jgi:hypothetical protein
LANFDKKPFHLSMYSLENGMTKLHRRLFN